MLISLFSERGDPKEFIEKNHYQNQMKNKLFIYK